MGDDWHCRQILNGSNPIIVCERESLLAEIDRLCAAGDALAAALVPDLCDCANTDCVALWVAHKAWMEARRG